MRNYQLSNGLFTHLGYDCKCLCHTRRAKEIAGECLCLKEARGQKQANTLATKDEYERWLGGLE